MIIYNNQGEHKPYTNIKLQTGVITHLKMKVYFNKIHMKTNVIFLHLNLIPILIFTKIHLGWYSKKGSRKIVLYKSSK